MADTRKTGIDVSEYQGMIQWAQVQPHVDFAIIRAGLGKNNIDKYARRNMENCIKHGIPFGLYWMSYAYTVEMAKNEARFLLDFVGDNRPEYPLYFDWEYDSLRFATDNHHVYVTKNLVRDMATAFCEELEAAGFYAGIYTNPDFIQRYYGEEIFQRFDLWIAHYGVSDPGRPVHLWQPKVTRIPGISGNVDYNIAFYDFPAVIKAAGLNNWGEKKPAFVCPLGYTDCPHKND